MVMPKSKPKMQMRMPKKKKSMAIHAKERDGRKIGEAKIGFATTFFRRSCEQSCSGEERES